MTEAEFKKYLDNQFWRLNNLYQIINEDGQRVVFKIRYFQYLLLRNMWFLNIILKARQHGFTTFIALFFLDTCLFAPNTSAAIIAHNLSSAKRIFAEKIKFPFDNLPAMIKTVMKPDTQNKMEFAFPNGSSICVAVSTRSGTYQYLLVSEFGKICAKTPDKAKEIVTGSFNAVASGNFILIESTAEGRSGYFYDYCQRSRADMLQQKHLTPLDFKFFFFPWWENPRYALSDDDTPHVVIPSKMTEYFQKLEKLGIKLTAGQKAWYVKKKEMLGVDIKAEYPSTYEEAFEKTLQGAFFVEEFERIYAENRITVVPYNPTILVDTWWDLGIGVNNETAIWFTQNVGRQIQVIDFYQCNGVGLAHYKDILTQKGYRYGRTVAPHDIEVTELGPGKTRKETGAELGIQFETVIRCESKADSIQAARNILGICVFDAEKCSEGIISLESYRRKWDDKNEVYLSQPLHDKHSNPSDAFQTMAMGHTFNNLIGQPTGGHKKFKIGSSV
jgi:hypothetical protein